MKKTLVALVVTAFAASASAVTVYENESTKLNVNGRVNLSIKNETKDGNRTDLYNQSSRVTFAAEHKIAEGFKGLANIEIRPDLKGNVTAARVWAGFSSKDVGTLTFGRQLTNGDALGLSDFTNLYGGVNQVTGFAPKAVKFTSAEFAGFTFGADYLFGESDRSKKATAFGNYRNGVGLGLFYKNKFNDNFTFKSNVGFSSETYDLAHREAEQRQAWLVAVGAEVGAFEFGIDYSQVRDTSKSDYVTLIFDKSRGAKTTSATKADIVEVGAKYKINPSLDVYGAFIHGRGKNAAKTAEGRQNEGILGTTYFFNKNVRTYVEGTIGKFDVTENGHKYSHRNNKIGVGLRVDF